ncbi:MAG TPA: IS481 family transposase [Gemmataceae bacterium]|jgi:transposase InsO family protein|nr:IS481 family transposase [Gemmataceae bacterium]
MPWKEVSRMSLRCELVHLAQQPDANVALLAQRFGISRKTAYKWLQRFQAGGLPALADQSRRPRASPARTAEALEQLVLQLRAEHPAWGGRKLRARLLALGQAHVPAPSTITAILRRHGCLDSPRAGQPRAWQRFEHPAPNDLWQMDFKGHFGLTDGTRCHPLTVLDDHSRYALGLVACADEQTATVRAALTTLFGRYGLPGRMLMDNGSPWGDDGDNPYTTLTVWLLRLGIGISHGRAYHPQTQGKDERFHRTLNAELLTRRTFGSVASCQAPFDTFRQLYNHERPHEALAMAVPASRYQPSPRALPAELPPIVYDTTDVVRKVQEGGWFSYRGGDYRLSVAFRGYPIALRVTGQEGELGVWFCGHRVGTLDLRRRQLQRRVKRAERRG